MALPKQKICKERNGPIILEEKVYALINGWELAEAEVKNKILCYEPRKLLFRKVKK